MRTSFWRPRNAARTDVPVFIDEHRCPEAVALRRFAEIVLAKAFARYGVRPSVSAHESANFVIGVHCDEWFFVARLMRAEE
jgi:hypothetical protein